jgi:hypothetical protein
MNDFLKDQIAAIDNRLRELKPLHDEYLQLQKARDALAGVGAPGRRGRPRGSGTGGTSPPRRRRRRRGGTRAEEALALLRQNPGMTVREMSEQMKIKHPNYLYRVLGGLEADGAVRKEGKGWAAV